MMKIRTNILLGTALLASISATQVLASYSKEDTLSVESFEEAASKKPLLHSLADEAGETETLNTEDFKILGKAPITRFNEKYGSELKRELIIENLAKEYGKDYTKSQFVEALVKETQIKTSAKLDPLVGAASNITEMFAKQGWKEYRAMPGSKTDLINKLIYAAEISGGIALYSMGLTPVQLVKDYAVGTFGPKLADWAGNATYYYTYYESDGSIGSKLKSWASYIPAKVAETKMRAKVMQGMGYVASGFGYVAPYIVDGIKKTSWFAYNTGTSVAKKAFNAMKAAPSYFSPATDIVTAGETEQALVSYKAPSNSPKQTAISSFLSWTGIVKA
jgi:hypothetical protein